MTAQGPFGKSSSVVAMVDRDGAARVIFPPSSSYEAVEVGELFDFRAKEGESFQLWLRSVFAGKIPFDDLVALCPMKSRELAGRRWGFDFRAVRDEAGVLTGILMMATEKAKVVVPPSAAAKSEEPVDRLMRLAAGRSAFRLFMVQMEGLLKDFLQPELLSLEEIARRLHTAKSGAASFLMRALADRLQELEKKVALVRDEDADKTELDAELSAASNELRAVVDAERKAFRDYLFLLAADVAPQSSDQAGRESSVAFGSFLGHQEISLKGLAESLGKKVEQIEIVGGDLLLPSKAHWALASTLVHALRNSVYHGIESPEERKRAQKPAGGKIRVAFALENAKGGRRVCIEIADDGRGVDLKKVRAELENRERHALAAAEDDVVVQALLEGALTTAEMGPVAGSGLGLSAIATEVGKLGGTIRLSSTPGRGFKIEIVVPYAGDVTSDRAA